ncbi:MAG: DUF2764 domain-containing protein [Prolixibacteraceae bacterium]|nr:DUF2764 domain-containing protein [Prolixibacteraceae bacterium]
MKKRNYYCLVAGLPDIVIDDKKMAMPPVQLRDYLEQELHPDDFGMVKLFYLPWDHQNLVQILFHSVPKWDDRGNYTREEMETLANKRQLDFVEPEKYPAYFISFLEDFFNDDMETTETGALAQLTECWYNMLDSHPNEFVRQVASFGRTKGNVMLALNGRKHQLDYEKALIGDDDITTALKKSRARDFGLSGEVAYIDNLTQIFETNNILEREQKIDNQQWNYLDEITVFDYFTAEKVLAFVLKYFMVERWFVLEKEKGQEMFGRLLQELQSNFEFPDEFTINYGKRK